MICRRKLLGLVGDSGVLFSVVMPLIVEAGTVDQALAKQSICTSPFPAKCLSKCFVLRQHTAMLGHSAGTAKPHIGLVFFKQLRPMGLRELQALCMAPLVNGGVVAAEQHIGHALPPSSKPTSRPGSCWK